MILGDFNISVNKNQMKCCCNIYGLKNLIMQSTCYKNSENQTCIDLVLKDVPHSFHSTSVLEAGLPGFPFMNLTVNKKDYKKFQSRSLL